MSPPRPTALAHTLLREIIHEGDTVIDATAGNGHDTLFLAGLVGPSGKVIAYDIQEPAITATRQIISDAGLQSRVELHHASHAHMAEHATPHSVAAVMFNLGYLPGQDHDLTTTSAETLTALEVSTSLIKPGGSLSVVCYPGHEEGSQEADQVESWMSSLSRKRWRIAKYAMLGTQRPAPFLLLASMPNTIEHALRQESPAPASSQS